MTNLWTFACIVVATVALVAPSSAAQTAGPVVAVGPAEFRWAGCVMPGVFALTVDVLGTPRIAFSAKDTNQPFPFIPCLYALVSGTNVESAGTCTGSLLGEIECAWYDNYLTLAGDGTLYYRQLAVDGRLLEATGVLVRLG